MSAELTEKRRESRNALRGLVDFVVEQNEDRTLTANVMNISNSGLRIYLGYALGEGQTVLISDRLPNGCQRYRVQWCNKVTEDFFEAGLKSLS